MRQNEISKDKRVMINLDKFSLENLHIIQKVLRIVLETIELQGFSKLTDNKIPLEKFSKEDLFYNDVISSLERIDTKNNISIMNEYYKIADKNLRKYYNLQSRKIDDNWRNISLVSTEELESYIFLKIENLEELKNTRKKINKKLLSLENNGDIKEKKIDYTPFFNLDKSILTIGDDKIGITKFSDQYHLLRILFEDRKELDREWFFSEIAERYDSKNNFPDKKFYNAIYRINQKIAMKTNVKDYFKSTTQSFIINPDCFK